MPNNTYIVHPHMCQLAAEISPEEPVDALVPYTGSTAIPEQKPPPIKGLANDVNSDDRNYRYYHENLPYYKQNYSDTNRQLCTQGSVVESSDNIVPNVLQKRYWKIVRKDDKSTFVLEEMEYHGNRFVAGKYKSKRTGTTVVKDQGFLKFMVSAEQQRTTEAQSESNAAAKAARAPNGKIITHRPEITFRPRLEYGMGEEYWTGDEFGMEGECERNPYYIH